jgi:prephenate dehydrogenase
MNHWDRVAIVGVGLIGGSLGWDLLRRGLAREVVGIGRRSEPLGVALERGLITRTAATIAEGVAGADLIVVCTPVDRIAQCVLEAAAECPGNCLITDAGSTKAALVAQLDEQLPPAARFVGSHPLAGSHHSGPQAAVSDLFVGRTVVVTPTARTRPADAEAICGLWQSLDARVVRLSPEEHDRLVAYSSHLPHLAASALAAATPKAARHLVAGGWLDTTRIAAADSALWTQIFLSNRGHALTALAGYEKLLRSLRRALQRSDADTIEKILTKARRTRDAVGS